MEGQNHNYKNADCENSVHLIGSYVKSKQKNIDFKDDILQIHLIFRSYERLLAKIL